MATLKESTGQNFDDRMGALMSLRQGFRASRLALSDNNVVSLTPVGSGPQQPEWLARYDPESSRLRTRQRSLLSTEGEPGTELCQAWSRSGMICSGMYFPLPASEQDICESASSSSPYVPTPTTQQDQGFKSETQRKSPCLTVAMKLALLPTPVANDAQKRGTAYWQEHRQRTTFSDNLPRTIGKLIPTPTTRDYKDTPGMALESTNKDGSNRNRDDQLPRRIFREFLPTPNTWDHKTGYSDAISNREMQLKKHGHTATKPLAHRILEKCQTFEGGSEISKTASLGGTKLTPEFLCWLQGFPVNWLKPLRLLLATPFVRKSRSASPEESKVS